MVLKLFKDPDFTIHENILPFAIIVHTQNKFCQYLDRLETGYLYTYVYMPLNSMYSDIQGQRLRSAWNYAYVHNIIMDSCKHRKPIPYPPPLHPL